MADKSVRRTLVVLLLTLFSLVQLAFAFQFVSPERMLVGHAYDDRILVPTNQVLTLAGSRIQLPGWPVDLALNPTNDDRIAVLLADGIQILSTDGTLLRRIPLQKTSFGGLVFTPDGQSVIAGHLGKTDSLVSADPVTGTLTTLVDFAAGSIPTGVAISQTGERRYWALNGRH